MVVSHVSSHSYSRLVHELERIIPELTRNEQVLKQDRKNVEDVVDWLRCPSDPFRRELILGGVRSIEHHAAGEPYRERPEGRAALLRAARTLREIVDVL